MALGLFVIGVRKVECLELAHRCPSCLERAIVRCAFLVINRRAIKVGEACDVAIDDDEADLRCARRRLVVRGLWSRNAARVSDRQVAQNCFLAL